MNIMVDSFYITKLSI